ncbi:N-acylglucosamine 2-epimerase [Paenibacillus sp. LMG 31458]|uniref:N-acylglucosamine 2-epimerase n=1 Tax=Paenibacillus phytorum TaxID=2654977 RepID=A0ABX1Y5B8_9BACL|nr:AGE family epimerase/isomerase [Paenibacillus phytorum]NOU75185.1 N-acylglucosamine 2-epimerase [Paenibacillus phytorum]
MIFADDELDNVALLKFYEQHLVQDLLPFWNRALDKKYGGVFTCFNNAGTESISTDKYTWSQGRFVWLWARIASMMSQGILRGNAVDYLDQAEKTVHFLKKYAIMENGNCAFLITESGDKKESIPGAGYDTSFYADCFVVLGFAEFGRVSRRVDIVEDALQLYNRIRQRLQTSDVRSEPYPIPEGFKAHSVPMILLNVSQQLMDTLEAMDHPQYGNMRDNCLLYMEQIMGEFAMSDHRIAEILPIQGVVPDSVLCRHVNPGHTLECMWFVMNTAAKLNRADLIDKVIPVIKKAYELGWDSNEGGLLRFVDREGGKPKGFETGDTYEALILDTWDSKLWWPHSEALYCSLLAYELSKDKEFVTLYEKTQQYVFEKFPNSDKQIGEWIQILDRKGFPLEKVVALPVKDPFHIIRNVLLIIELYADKIRKQMEVVRI